MLWWHQTGRRVVCINAVPDISGAPWGLLTEGGVYTICRAVEAIDSQMHFRVWFILDEIAGTGFYADRFRPARNTSIEGLRRLLSPELEDA